MRILSIAANNKIIIMYGAENLYLSQLHLLEDLITVREVITRRNEFIRIKPSK